MSSLSGESREARIAEIEQALAAAQPGPWYFTLVPESDGNVCIEHEHWDVYRFEADVEVERSEPGIFVGKIAQREANVACVLGDAPDLHVIANAPHYLAFLLRELRDALTREAALQKDAEGRIAIWRMYAYAAAQALTPLGETCEFDDPDSLEGAISRLVERVQSEGR